MTTAHKTLLIALIDLFERLTDAEVRAVMLRVGPRAHLELLRVLLALRPRSWPAIAGLAAASGLAPPPQPVRSARLGLAAVLTCTGLFAAAIAASTRLAADPGPAPVQSALEPSVDVSTPAAVTRSAPMRTDPVAPSPPAPEATTPPPAGGSATRGRVRGGSRAAPLALADEHAEAPALREQWTVARVEGKRLTLGGGALPSRGLLALATPADGRRFASEVLCRIEEAPGTCWVVALPGNDAPRIGDVFVWARAEDR